MSTQEIPTPDQQDETATISTRNFELGTTTITIETNGNTRFLKFNDDRISPITVFLDAQNLEKQIAAFEQVLQIRSTSVLKGNDLRSSIVAGFNALSIDVNGIPKEERITGNMQDRKGRTFGQKLYNTEG